jgi:hypothetical protein
MYCVDQMMTSVTNNRPEPTTSQCLWGLFIGFITFASLITIGVVLTIWIVNPISSKNPNPSDPESFAQAISLVDLGIPIEFSFVAAVIIGMLTSVRVAYGLAKSSQKKGEQ